MDAPPDFYTMIIVSILALIANGFFLYLLQKSKSEEAHMKVSMIFTSNDVNIYSGVILADILVSILYSNKPDLIIGSIVFIIAYFHRDVQCSQVAVVVGGLSTSNILTLLIIPTIYKWFVSTINNKTVDEY